MHKSIIFSGEKMKKVLFFKNAAILTITSLIVRTVGIFFRIWLTGKIGAEGIGLYQVVFSVYVLATTFATSGICTAVTRIVAARFAENDGSGAKRAVKIACILSLIIAVITMAAIFLFANFIAKYIIKDIRATLSLKILCLGLPFIGICSCLRGYFLARRSTLPSSFSQIAEQIIRISVIVLLIGRTAPYGLEASAAAVMAGDGISEAAGAFCLYISYRLDSKKVKPNIKSKGGILKEILRISVPISSGRYVHTTLRTAENLLTPICFSKYKGTSLGGLEQFGMIKGMALPLLMFPASILSSVSMLLVTEITESAEKGNKKGIAISSEKVIYITSVFSFLIAGIFFSASGNIGQIVYKSKEVGYLIRAVSPLVPFMYLDLICDGILKGLDSQKLLFMINVIDSAVRVVLVLVLVPMYGMTGFLGVMIFSNLFTSLAAVIKIVSCTGLKVSIKRCFLAPLFSVIVAVAVVGRFLVPISSDIVFTLASAIGISAVYFFALYLQNGGLGIDINFNKKHRYNKKRVTKNG